MFGRGPFLGNQVCQRVDGGGALPGTGGEVALTITVAGNAPPVAGFELRSQRSHGHLGPSLATKLPRPLRPAAHPPVAGAYVCRE